MGNVYKQKGSIVLYKEERNGTDYIRIEYANSPTVALLLAYDEGIETTGSGWAYMEAASFKPVDFHKRYSPYAFIDYNKVYSLHFLQQQNFIPPIEPEKTIETPDFPRNLITEGLMEITLSAQGHLSRPSRHKILRSLRSLRMVGRIGILCAFKVLPTWRKWSGNSYEIIELLRKAEYYLWGKTNEKDVIEAADRISALVQGYDYGTNFVPFMAGMSAVRAAYAVTASSLSEEVFENDGQTDSDKWDAAFLASLSYNKRTADIEEIDPELNRKFWTWYLTDCIPFVYESEKHPRYYTDNRISIPIPANCNAILYDGINRFNSALDSYVHAPTNRKEILRMQPYATDEKLVRTVAGFLQGYCCIPSNAQELENYCMIGHFYYDIIRFWYCVALLALSSDSAALDCLTRLAHTLMEQGPGDLHVLYRILLLLPEQSSLNGLRQELSDYYKNTIPTLIAAQWLAKAEIPYPDDFEWNLSFHFTSNGEMFPTSNNQEEKKAWYILRVDMFGPRTLFNDYTRFTSYQIYLRNGDHSIHGSWNEKDGFLIRDGESLMENELHTPTLLVLLMHRLAEYGIRFSKVPARLYTSKGISRKSVESWIKNVMKAYEDDRMQETRDNALDILKYEGDIEDTVVELRKKWGDVVSVLKDKRFDEIVNQYSCFSHEIGISALGQELTACGYALYNLDEDDIYLLELIPQAEMGAFEKKCHKYGQYCKLLKQPHRDFGIQARHIAPRKQMPRMQMVWPNDNICYITRGFAGYFAYGEWKQESKTEWQGTFIVDLRVVPLQPVKFKTKKIHSFIYSKELDFYAALYSTSLGEMPVAGKNPLEAEKWPRVCDLSVYDKYEFQWCGHYLCLGDVHSAIVHTMTEQGVKYVSRIILPEGLIYAPSFGIDGKGTLYIVMGEYSQSKIIRYDDNGKYITMPFSMSGYETFYTGSSPVPNTTRLLLLHEYTVSNNSGIWLEPGLLDLDMATQRCRIAPLHHIGDGLFRLRIFYEDWILIEGDHYTNGNRSDYARLWNWSTDEVLRIRPGVFGSESFKALHALPDGTIVVNTHQHTDDILSLPEDLWNFLRMASRPKKLGYWLNYPNPYPNIDYLLPPVSEDVSLMLAPPYVKTQITGQQPVEKITPKECSTLSVTDGVEITEGILKINGQKISLPLSYTTMVNIFGREKVVFTHRNMQDDNGKMVQYDKRSFLIWDKAGVTAIRNEENVYNISVIYLWVAEDKKSISSLPAPTGLFDCKITVDGTLWSKKADMTTRSGEMEIVASASGGYMEITFARTRDQKITWQNYRKIMVENFQYALIKRDCIKQLEKNIRIGKPTKNLTENVHLLEEMSEAFLVCMIQALHAGYAMGRGERYLKSNMLLPLTEAAIKCIEHGTIKSSDMLSVYSGCVLLNCEKMTMKRLSEIMMKNGVRDFVFDTLIRYRIPDWEVTEYTVFPEVKKWITSQTKSRNMTEARAALQKISCISENILIADALITSTF